MCLVDRRARVLLADAELCGLLGLSPFDVQGQLIWQLMPGTSLETRRLHDEARLGRVVESARHVFGTGAAQVECDIRLSCVALPEGSGVLMIIVGVHTRSELSRRESGIAPARLPRSEAPASSLPAEQLAALVQASPVPILATDAEGRGLLWSAAAERLFGFRAHEVIGKPLPIVPEDKREEFDQLRYIARTQPHVVNLVTERVTRDGRRVTVSQSAGALRGRHGEVIGNVAVLIDLTESRSLQRELEISKRRFVELFEASPVAKTLYRPSERRIVEANRAFLELSQLERSQVVGVDAERIAEAFCPDPEARALLHAAFSSPVPVRDLEYQFRWPNGEVRDALANIQPLEITGERFVLFATQDVTERKRVEHELRESNERFRQVAETMQEVFWLSHPHRRELIYISPAYEQMFGRSRESLYAHPQTWIDVVHAEDRERVKAVFEGPADWAGEMEYRVVLPDGAVRWIRSRAYPVRDAQGQVIRIAGAAQDITEHRALEAQLRQTQRLESIGLLAGGVAHDFNNLLTVILGSCDVLRALLPEPSECDEIVEEIHCAGERAAGLTRQLLAFSRRSVMEPRVLDLSEVVLETEKLLRRILGEDVTLTTSLPSTPVRVRVDAGAFGQLLMNLAVNARDAMPRGGNLRIALTRSRLSAADARARPPLEPGPHAALSVSDDGTGIPKELQAHIFEPFFTTKEPGKGTGLGLSVAHGIVAQHDGWIEVDSAARRGTTFRILLPLVDAVQEDAKDTDLGVAAGTERLLLVEDDAAIRRVASRVLSRLGYTVLQAGSGREALELLEAQSAPVDLVITDVIMPEMSGRELAEALRERAPNTRVLFTSGYTDDAVLRHGIQRAEVAFLRKPYTPIKLALKIREQLEQ